MRLQEARLHGSALISGTFPLRPASAVGASLSKRAQGLGGKEGHGGAPQGQCGPLPAPPCTCSSLPLLRVNEVASQLRGPGPPGSPPTTASSWAPAPLRPCALQSPPGHEGLGTNPLAPTGQTQTLLSPDTSLSLSRWFTTRPGPAHVPHPRHSWIITVSVFLI